MKLTASLIRRLLANALVEANTKATVYFNLSNTSPDPKYKDLHCTWSDRYDALKDFDNYLTSIAKEGYNETAPQDDKKKK